MAKLTNRLTTKQLSNLITLGRHHDGNGLYLQVITPTNRSWLLRYAMDGKAHWLGLGAAHAFNLAEARERARKARQLLADGIDPLAAKKAERAARAMTDAKAMTFREAAQAYIADKRAGWKNPKHADQWTATLTTYAYPVIGDLPVAAVELGHVMTILRPLWQTRTETASRLRGRIESILGWATVNGLRTGDNPSRWRGHLDKLLPARSKVRPIRNQPAMAWQDVPAFTAELRSRVSVSASALEFAILTAARTGEVVGARWSEIDGETWTIPGTRMKAGKPHVVPLSPRAVEILNSLPREQGNDHLFIGGKPGHGLSGMAMLQLLRGMRPGVVVHGFRSSFRTWCAESTNTPRELAEQSLAHIVRGVEGDYQRGSMLLKRRKLMEAWSRYCMSNPVKGGNVVSIRAAAQ